jgi:hypothetical protein
MSIELSADGINFKNIYTINMPGSKCGQPFSFTNFHPLYGNNYYRLKTIGSNKRAIYSNTILLNNKIEQLSIAGLYPNPAENEIKVKIISPAKSDCTIKILDATGKPVLQQLAHLTEGVNIINVVIQNLAAGNYTLTGNSSLNSLQAVQFIKLR